MIEDFVKLFYDVDTTEVQEKYAGDETVIKLLNAVADLTDPERVMKYVSDCDDCVLCPTHAVSRVSVFADARDAVWMWQAHQQIATVGKELMLASIQMRELRSYLEGQESIITLLQTAIDIVKTSIVLFEAEDGHVTMPAEWRDGVFNALCEASTSYSKNKLTIDPCVSMEVEKIPHEEAEKEA